jgi:hypothetical protein
VELVVNPFVHAVLLLKIDACEGKPWSLFCSPFMEDRFYTDLSLKELKPIGRPSNCAMSIIGGGSNINIYLCSRSVALLAPLALAWWHICLLYSKKQSSVGHIDNKE